MISPRSWVWPVFSPITDSVFLPLRCQKKAEEADRPRRSKDLGPEGVFGGVWGFVLLNWNEEGSALLSKLCVWLRLPTPRCVYSAVLGIVCVPTCPCCCFPGMLGCVSRASSHLLAYSLTWPFVLPLLLPSLVLGGQRDTMVTFDSRLSQPTDWHTT